MRALERLDGTVHELLLQQDPPTALPYAADPRFLADLQQLTGLASQARTLAAAADLAGARDRLDAYAEVLAELRIRNGVAHLSDRLTAFNRALQGLMASLGPTAPSGIPEGDRIIGLREHFLAMADTWEQVRPMGPEDARWATLADAVERAMVALNRALDAHNLVTATERAHQLERAFAALRREFG